jgi:hypothetical protein
LFELLPHQSEAVAKLRNGNVLVGGVGSGKSIASLAYFTSLDPSRPIYVLTTALKRDSGDWFADAMKMSLRNELIVDSWNNIKKFTDVENAFFILDEQRIVGKGAWVKAFYEIAKKNEWILLSATPADTWVDLVPIFVANGFFRNQTQFNNEHVRFSRFTKYPKIDGYYDTWLLEQYRDRIYVEMPYLSPAKRNEHIIEVDFDQEEQKLLYTARWNFHENMPLKDAGEMMRYLRLSANTHPSRYDKIVELAADHPKMIIFYNFDYELDILRLLHSELDIPVAEWNGHNHQDVPDGDRWLYFVQYQAGSEAWNCTRTDTTVFYSLPYSYRQFHQAKGRTDRQNTPYAELNYYIFKSRAFIDQAIWKALRRKKNFQASAFAKRFWPKENTLNQAA